jgi:hypothetical protein
VNVQEAGLASEEGYHGHFRFPDEPEVAARLCNALTAERNLAERARHESRLATPAAPGRRRQLRATGQETGPRRPA